MTLRPGPRAAIVFSESKEWQTGGPCAGHFSESEKVLSINRWTASRPAALVVSEAPLPENNTSPTKQREITEPYSVRPAHLTVGGHFSTKKILTLRPEARAARRKRATALASGIARNYDK